MAIADLDAYRQSLVAGPQLISINKTTVTTLAGRSYDLWVPNAPAGAVPSAAVVPTNATQGALGQRNGGAGTLGIVAAQMNPMIRGMYTIYDRLSHQGGLSGTVTTAQTTNLPTAALTRYTSGEGVQIGLTIYSAVGTTATTVTATYTNSEGTGSRVTPNVVIGGTGNREARRMIMLPLQAGDSGVRSVQSVTVTATTGTAGNFGVTLFKPLASICAASFTGMTTADFISGNLGGGLPEIVDGACLSLIVHSMGVNGMASGALILQEW